MDVPSNNMESREWEWWQPKFDNASGLVVTGDRSCIFVIQVFENQRVQFSIPAQVRITGWEIHDGSLYVQDGVVLSSWDIQKEKRIYARNFITGKTWSSKVQGDFTEKQLEAFYQLPEDLMKLQNALLEALHMASWGNFLWAMLGFGMQGPSSEDDDKTCNALFWSLMSLLKSYFPPKEKKLLKDIKGVINRGSTDWCAPGYGIKNMAKIAMKPWAAAWEAGLCFSAPVIRKHQLGTPVVRSVFTLGSDGELHAMDDTLQHMQSVNPGAPYFVDSGSWYNRATNFNYDPYLFLSENPSDNTCDLFYRTKPNTPLPRINADTLVVAPSTSDLPNPFEGIAICPGQSDSAEGTTPPTSPEEDALIPGLSDPRACMQILSTNKLLFVLSGSCICYFDRSNSQWTSLSGLSPYNNDLFFNTDVTEASDILLLGVDPKSGADSSGKVFSLVSPSSSELNHVVATGLINSGNLATHNEFNGKILSIPGLVKQNGKVLYFVMRNAKIYDAIDNLMDASSGQSGWDLFLAKYKNEYGSDDSGWDLSKCPLPDLQLEDYLLAFDFPPDFPSSNT